MAILQSFKRHVHAQQMRKDGKREQNSMSSVNPTDMQEQMSKDSEEEDDLSQVLD